LAEELPVSEVFAQSIRALRKRRGWNQQQLAERLTKLGHRAHQTTVGKYETGRRRPTLDDAIAIATALDTDLIYMLDGSWLTEDEEGHRRDVRVRLVNNVPERFAGGLLPRDVRRWLRGEQPLPWQDIYRFRNPVPRDVWLESRQRRDELAAASRAASDAVAQDLAAALTEEANGEASDAVVAPWEQPQPPKEENDG
jgi:transcriptional regulator with XRE-family HTH domain